MFKWMDVFKRMYTFYKHIDEHKANRLNMFIQKSQLTGFAFMDEDTLNNFIRILKEYVVGKAYTYTRIDDDILFEHQIESDFLLSFLEFGEIISKVEYLCYCATYPNSGDDVPIPGYHCVGNDFFKSMCIEKI